MADVLILSDAAAGFKLSDDSGLDQYLIIPWGGQFVAIYVLHGENLGLWTQIDGAREACEEHFAFLGTQEILDALQEERDGDA